MATNYKLEIKCGAGHETSIDTAFMTYVTHVMIQFTILSSWFDFNNCILYTKGYVTVRPLSLDLKRSTCDLLKMLGLPRFKISKKVEVVSNTSKNTRFQINLYASFIVSRADKAIIDVFLKQYLFALRPD